MPLEIRDAESRDEAAWRKLWAQHFLFHKTTVSPAVNDSTWNRILNPQSTLRMRVALIDDRLAGYAIHFAHPSSWIEGDECYLEDLYTDEAFRGQGIGRALMDDLIALAKTSGWSNLYWHADQANAGARKLYDQYLKADTSVRYRMKLSAD